LQHRHSAHGVDLQELRGAVLRLGEVDLLVGDLDAFFGEEDSHATRIGRYLAVVELHRCFSFGNCAGILVEL
jgi:hypothetical protein